MTSSCVCAAMLQLNLSEPLSALDNHLTPEGHPQSVSEPHSYCFGAAGVLRYNRESDSHRIDLTTILTASQSLTEYTVKCEYCGEKAQPSLDLTWVQQRETVFCCARWQQLCEMLVRQRHFVGGRCGVRTDTPTSPRNKPATNTEELLFQGRETEDHNKFIMDLPSGLGDQSELKIYEDHSIQLPVAETFAPTSKVLSFRLSCAPGKGCCIVSSSSAAEKHLEINQEEKEEEQALMVPFCNHKPQKFGICHHQDGSEFLQKYYSNGLLALVVVVTEENGRVCIVYDDSDEPCQPIRAMFQCDGRATCYHSNGNIWLALNTSGGQCLDEEGARVRRWNWSSLSPTPLHPVFLSLNKAIGVRVLGREQVFVSFLARGQQAKFRVGTCCAQGECKIWKAVSGPSVLKEELLVLAARIRIHLAFQHLHQYLTTPSHPQPLRTSHGPHLHAVAQKILAVSADVMMRESERAFIQRCLQDCL